jgi:hypothetical protein
VTSAQNGVELRRYFLGASVDQTDARSAKAKGIVWVGPPACRVGLKCRPAKPGRSGRRESHPLKKPDQTAPVPQPFSSRTDRPIVSVSAWLALADWFRRYQQRDQGEHPCDTLYDEGSPPVPHGRHPIRSGPQCPTPLAGADSRRADPTNSDLAAPPAAAPPGPQRQGGLP